MTHPSDLLDRYSAGLLPPSALVAIDGHLEECDACRTDLVAPPAMDLERAWTAITEGLELEAIDRPAAAPVVTETSTEAEDTPRTFEAPVSGEPRPRRNGAPWFRRPAVVFAASAVAVLLVIGGVALLLGPFDSDTPPVVTEAPTSTVTTTPTTTAVEPVTTSSLSPTATASVIVPAETVPRGDAVIASVDTAGDTGGLPAIAIGSDGLPVVAYLDRTDGVVKVATCGSADCSGDNVITTLGPADGETAPAMALSPAGLPVVAYGVVPDDGALPSGVMLARCAGNDCTTFTTAPLPVDTTAGIGSLALVVGTDDRPVVFFVGESVFAAVCQDPECSDTSLTTIDEAEGMGPGMTSAAVGPDGIPAIVYNDGRRLKFAVCDDAQCTARSAGATLVEDLGDGAVSLAYSPAGMPVIAYTQLVEIVGSSTVSVITCADRTCSESATSEIEVGAAANVAIAVTPGGLPFAITSFRDVSVVSCTDPDCAGPVVVSRMDTEAGWGGASVAIGSDGMPRFAYNAGSDLRVATCTAMPCQAELPPPPDPGERGIITTVVSEADAELIGANPSLVIDDAGRPLVMYTTGQETPQPKLIRCLDTACSVFTSADIDVAGFHNTLALGPNGLPAIAHHDWDRVYITSCADAGCTATSTVELEASEFAYVAPVAVGFDDDGTPIVAFQNTNDYYIHVVACEDPTCSSMSSGRVETFADADNSRWWTNNVDIVIPSDGLPFVAAGQMDGAVRVAKCADRACTQSTATIVDATGLGDLTSGMILGSDDLPLIAYYADGDLRAAKCENPSCTEHTVTTIGDGISDFIASVAPSIAINADGLPVIAYWAPGRVLQLASCSDQACTSSTLSMFGNANTFALAIGADGRPVIAYHDDPEVVVAKCGDATCGSG